MIVMMAVKGREDSSFFQRAAALVRLTDAERIILAHVVDQAVRADLERGRERFLGNRPLNTARSAELLQLEQERAHAIVQLARQALIAAGVPGERMEEIVLRGEPREELRHLAERHGVDLLIVQARPGAVGPKSLGKTARFLVDHCPRAVLLVR